MKAEVLQETTYAKDINGKPLVVGDVAELDPSLGNQWACLGIVRITDHGPTTATAMPGIGEPNEHGHIYRMDPDFGLVRDYSKERSLRKINDRVAKITKKPKRKEAETDATDQSGTSADEE